MRLKERNSRSRLKTRDWKTDILDPDSKVEISLSLNTVMNTRPAVCYPAMCYPALCWPAVCYPIATDSWKYSNVSNIFLSDTWIPGLEAWDWKKEILVLVSKHEIERLIFWIPSQKLNKPLVEHYYEYQACCVLPINMLSCSLLTCCVLPYSSWLMKI